MKLRKSKTRDLICNILSKKNYHPTVDEIYAITKSVFPKISLATVYRNLNQLVELKRINILEFDKNSARYDGNIEKHFHIICEKCGKVEDVWLKKGFDNLQNVSDSIKSFDLTGYKLVFFGVCDDCKKNKKGES